MNIRLCFKISEEVGLANDENGNPTEAYVAAKAKNVKSYVVSKDQYKNLQDGMAKIIAEQLGCSVGMLTPITLDEYLDNTNSED